MAPRRQRVTGACGLPLSLPLLLALLALLLLGPWPAATHGGKYSREKNEPESPAKSEPGEEFRMEKLKQLWEKARRVSGGRGRWAGAAVPVSPGRVPAARKLCLREVRWAPPPHLP